MEKTYNSLAELKKDYPNGNYVIPVPMGAQSNPFYKFVISTVSADLSDNSSDVFKVGAIKQNVNGRDIYVDTYSPEKALLNKLGAAAGIQFDFDRSWCVRSSEDTYTARALGAIQMPDGSWREEPDIGEINLGDEHSKFQFDFMDKAIKGITDERAAKEAATIFKGRWIDSTNRWGKSCKAYLLDESEREKYVSRSIFQNMAQLRKFAPSKAMTKAKLRVIKALLGLKNQYTKTELEHPFVVVRVAFSPDYTDPEVKRAMLMHGMNSLGSLFGGRKNALEPSRVATYDTTTNLSGMTLTADTIDSEASLRAIEEPMGTPIQIEEKPEAFNEIPQRAAEPEPVYAESGFAVEAEMQATGYACDSCGAEISEKVYTYSLNRMGRPLCIKCQRGGR